MTTSSIGPTTLGFARIGDDRQLKKDLEKYWRGDVDVQTLAATGEAIRRDALETARAKGLATVPVNTFSWYDQVLDTSLMVGAVPSRYAGVASDDRISGFDAAVYFAMARGNADVTPQEMTKWFDTNYHYLVPEIGPETAFALHAQKVLGELEEAQTAGVTARPVVVGPYSFLALAKASDEAPEGYDPLDRLDDLVGVYADLLAALADAGAEWVQLDEPSAVRDLDEATAARLQGVYETLAGLEKRPKILVATYFAAPREALPALAATPIEGIALDLVYGPSLADVQGVDGLQGKRLALGVVDGRNIWRTDLRAAAQTVREFADAGFDVDVSTSCSLLHVPYDLDAEKNLDAELVAGLAFGRQKIDEVVTIAKAVAGDDVESELDAATDGIARLARLAAGDGSATARVEAVTDADRSRPERSVRDAAQAEKLGLPPLPTTTIGSFPQTTAVRKARADLRKGTIDEAAYTEAMRQEVRDVIALQERIGLDVLVHGEPERNDMVQYFAEQLVGYAATDFGWVQSYGSRCVRPPVLYGDIARPTPMTVEWAQFAQSLTDKPVKGMLTGPVTMLAWSFVRIDQPLAVTADQVALALRDEVTDLEQAGIGIIQVDEPALRELLPLRKDDQQTYLAWAVDSFRLATAGVEDGTQIHTHLCYSEFGEIIESIDALNADVTSIEAARSKMELLADVAARGFSGGLGPGVYDIHSPRVPSTEEVSSLVEAALGSLPVSRLWINPDCGLKTRGYAEVEPALTALVEAAQGARATV